MYRSSILFALLSVVATVWAGTNEEGLAYLEANKAKSDVVTLESGLQYRVIKSGGGDFHPSVSSPCLCHYEGKLIDGSKFDSSYDRGDPTTFAPNQVIKVSYYSKISKLSNFESFSLTHSAELLTQYTGLDRSYAVNGRRR